MGILRLLCVFGLVYRAFLLCNLYILRWLGCRLSRIQVVLVLLGIGIEKAFLKAICS